VTPANEQDRSQVEVLAEKVQDMTGQNMELDTWTKRARARQRPKPKGRGIQLHVVKHTEAKQRSRTSSPALGGGAWIRLGNAVPPAGQRLRTAPGNGRRPASVAFAFAFAFAFACLMLSTAISALSGSIVPSTGVICSMDA
jgi:hypothetical protein